MEGSHDRRFFLEPEHTFPRRYEALRAILVDDEPIDRVAQRFGYKLSAMRSMISRFRADRRRVELLIWRAEAKLDAKDFAGAIADFTQWVERCSGAEDQDRAWVSWLAHVLINRAYARLEIGDAAGAEADSSLMVELSPESVDALLNRAEARAKLGRKADAKADVEAVLRLEPGNRDARKLLDALG